ncbi:bifunctional diguanylate cyclase/phosphodiesterase [Piscinibacter terrae]|uniref:EAL domain-containing protein n=1 Tax=Piscinibacter terrae TaxID=2496871 RepID=A0A3N7K184_9BURK|nr:EAL domain-containing protein [Albitalea terrae]RQP26759.1 EAL domain-containing protein [Albitalea terrae]
MVKRLEFLRGKFVLPIIVFSVGAALSAVLAVTAHQEIERGAQSRFDAVSLDAARKVQDRFDGYTEVLIGLRALFNTSETVSRTRFRQYVTGLNIAEKFPGFQVLNYAPYVPAAARAEFEASLRSDPALAPALASKIAIVPPGERAFYHPLAYIEPLAGNEATLGRDLSAVPTAMKALEQARDNNGLTSSGRKIQIKGRESDIGLAMRLPVYRGDMPHDTVDERRAAYIGSVGAGFRVAEMMKDVAGISGNEAPRIRLYDAGPSKGSSMGATDPVPVDQLHTKDANLLFDTQQPAADDKAAAAAFDRTFVFDMGGHSWLVQTSQPPDQVMGWLDRSIGAVVALSGLAISALLAGIVYSLNTSRGRAEGIARSMTQHLRVSQRRLDEAQQVANLGSWVIDVHSGEVHCSEQAMRMFGLPEGQPVELATLLSRVPSEERRDVTRLLADAQESRERAECEHQLWLPDGTRRWVHTIIQVAEENGRLSLRCTVRDDTQRRKAVMRMRLEHEVAQLLVCDGEHETVMSGALAAVCSHIGWDCGSLWTIRDNSAVRCSAAWQEGTDEAIEQFVRISRTLSYRADEGSLGRAFLAGEAVVVDTSRSTDHFTRDALAGQAGLVSGLIVPMLSVGKSSALELFSRRPFDIDSDMLDTLRAIGLQLAQYEQRKHAEQALRYVATHDSLTGLSNRATLQRDMARAIKRSNRHQKRFAVMFVDLDRFKRINDTLGHGVGDALIKACAERLSGVLREDDAVARFGGDEFVLVVENLSKASDAAVVAEKVLACCAEPFVIDGRELNVSASIGVSVYPEDGTDGETLLKNADTAMYRAKDKGRGGHEFYAAQMNAQGTERLMLESGLRRALERNELEMHYQPKMDLRTQRIVGVEALMRWRHPVLGMVSPAQFIPIAEETGLIVPMGLWALRTACAEARDWQSRGLPPVQMSVNLSVRQFASDSLVEDIAGVLNETGLNPELLELEITESVMMKSPETTAQLLQQIRRLGVGLAIDDFGTGYSSLSYLKRFPLTTVKIDRSFVNDLSQDPDSQALADGIVTLAHGLRMKVVAEGVETAEQLAYLRAHGCDEIQGYWLCKPMPAEDVCAFMARHLRTQFAVPVAA